MKLWWKICSILSGDNYRHTAERVCPAFPDDEYRYMEGLYEFAAQFVKGGVALDVGCGTGFGTDILARGAADSVFGIDNSDSALRYAARHYQTSTIQFQSMDAEEITYPNSSFDLVVSIHTLEHLKDPQAHLNHLRRVMKNHGTLVLATPSKEAVAPTSSTSPNPFRVKEFSQPELYSMIRKNFRSIYLFECAKDSPFPEGRAQKEERRRRRKIGIDTERKGTMKVGRTTIDLTKLKNDYSFVVVAW